MALSSLLWPVLFFFLLGLGLVPFPLFAGAAAPCSFTWTTWILGMLMTGRDWLDLAQNHWATLPLRCLARCDPLASDWLVSWLIAGASNEIVSAGRFTDCKTMPRSLGRKSM